MLGVPAGEIAFLIVCIAAAGILVGIFAGLFGIGGGSVIVPVLYEVFRVLGVPEDVRMQLCIGTSLAIIVPTNFMSYLAHKKKGAVIEDVVRVWTLPAIMPPCAPNPCARPSRGRALRAGPQCRRRA